VTVAAGTSVAVPLLARSHHDHASAARRWSGQEIALSSDRRNLTTATAGDDTALLAIRVPPCS
jgi:hypothetical protein